MLLKPGRIIGSYRIVSEAGHGGMATVYRAYQPSLNRHVAIKVMHDSLADDPDLKLRFSREASVIARLRHPNIVTVYDYGTDHGRLYIVMEFIENTLSSRLGRPLSVGEAVQLLRPVAEALDFAHRNDVIHRDVKPSNVLLSPDGVPVLTDFGLSWIANSRTRLTRSGWPLGTPEYMSPEVAKGQPSTVSVDFYALAVIGYEMLTGVVPYTAESPLAVLIAHSEGEPRPPRELNRNVSPEIEAVLLRGLEKTPEKRYRTAQDFVDALEEASQPVKPIAGTEDVRPKVVEPILEEGNASSFSPVFGAGLLDGPTPAARNPWPSAVVAALQYPVALLPFAASVLGLMYFVFLSPQLGLGTPVLVLAAALLAVGTKGALTHVGTEYELATERAAREQEAQRAKESYEQAQHVHQSLKDGFSSIESGKGLKVLAQLTMEFELWQASQYRREASDPLAMMLVPQLVTETYRRGISALSDALAIGGETKLSDAERLSHEADALVLDLEDALPEALKNQKEALLASHRQRLQGIEELSLAQENLFFHAQLCEAALHKGRIEVVAIRSGSSHGSVDGVIQALQKTIQQVKTVQEEIRRLGY